MRPFIILSIAVLSIFACKKEEEFRPDPITNFPPKIRIEQPDTNGFLSSVAEIPIQLAATDEEWIDYLEVRLYRVDDADTIPIYHHWEPGEGTSCKIDKLIKQRVKFNRYYKLKINSRDSSGKETEINHVFYLSYLDNVGPDVWYTKYSQHGQYVFYFRFDKTQNITPAVFDYSKPQLIEFTIREKQSKQIIGTSTYTNFTNWSNSAPYIYASITLGKNDFNQATVAGEVVTRTVDIHGNERHFLDSCSLVN